MTAAEERVWKCVLANRKASPAVIAMVAGVTEEYVLDILAKISSPNWQEELPVPTAKQITTERGSILAEAMRLTEGDRNKTYGEPVANMQHIADIFNAVTGKNLTARDIATVHVCTKMARRATSPRHRDSYVDAAAYTGIEYECALAEEKKDE